MGFDRNCASCGRGPEPREKVSILHVHLVVVARSPGKGASILYVHVVVVVGSPRGGFDFILMRILWSWRSPGKKASISNVHLAKAPGMGIRSQMCIL